MAFYYDTDSSEDEFDEEQYMNSEEKITKDFFEGIRTSNLREVQNALDKAKTQGWKDRLVKKINDDIINPYPPLGLAVKRRANLDIIKLLIKNGADVNETGPKGEGSQTPLYMAATGKAIDPDEKKYYSTVVKMLTDAGADTTKKSRTLVTAMMGSDRTWFEPEHSRTPLEAATDLKEDPRFGARLGNPDVVQTLTSVTPSRPATGSRGGGKKKTKKNKKQTSKKQKGGKKSKKTKRKTARK
jgi:hypothetical protein